MKKNNLKKVISFINKSDKMEISSDEVCDKLNIEKYEVFEIFDLLVESNKVIKAKSKSFYFIGKKGFIDYRSLSNIPNPNNIIYRLAKNTIIQIISIIVILYSFLKIIESIFNVDIHKI